MDVCKLNLSSWNEVEVRLYVIEVLFKLRELTSAKQRILICDNWWPPLFEACLVMCINHEVDKRTLHASAHAAKKIEASSCKLYATVKINHAQLGSKIPMRLWLKIKLSWLSPLANLRVIGVILAIRNRCVRNVWNSCNKSRELFLNLSATLVKLCDTVFISCYLLFSCLSLFLLALTHEKANLLRNSVALCLKRLNLSDYASALLIKLKEFLAIPMSILPGLARLIYEVRVLAHKFDIKHAASP